MAIDSNFDLAALGLRSAEETGQPKKKELGQEDFLRLMITQFRNQDPFKPMENGEFLGQLAQFSSVAGLSDLKNSFADLSASLMSTQTLQASSLLGRSVLVETDTVQLGAGGTVNGAVELDSSAGRVVVQVVDDTGAVVRRLELGTQPAGMVNFTWDGMTDSGVQAGAGEYTLVAQTVNNGEAAAAPTLIEATVESVTLGAAGRGLALSVSGLGEVDVSSVRQIS